MKGSAEKSARRHYLDPHLQYHCPELPRRRTRQQAAVIGEEVKTFLAKVSEAASTQHNQIGSTTLHAIENHLTRHCQFLA